MAKKRNNARRTTNTANTTTNTANTTTNTAANRSQPTAVKPTTKVSSANGNTNGSSAASARLAEARARNAAQRAQARRRAASNSFWRRNWPIITTVVSVVVLIAIFVAVANRANNTTGIGDPVPSGLAKQITGVSTTVFDAVTPGTGGIKTSLQVPQGATVLKDSAGKPIFLFIGADYCPFCAAERWSLITALSRFGTFKDLHLMRSAVSDGNIPTFTFHGSSYTSQYLTFQSVETLDRNSNPLETPTDAQNAIFTKYDAAPYTSQPGGIPFFTIANKYIQTNAGYQAPSDMSSMTWQQIGNNLSNSSNSLTVLIIGEANYLTAGICQATGQQPASVCTSANIKAFEAQLPKGS